MKFSVITPTYRRPEMLLAAINSVFVSGKDVTMIIVNDSPDFDYSTVEGDEFFIKLQKEGRIKYIKNPQNKGVNFSRNLALQNISSDTDFVMFLDDDDTLFPDAFSKIEDYLMQNKKINWLICDAYLEGRQFNVVKKQKQKYDFFWDILVLKNLKGDCAHVISRNLALSSKFSEVIKNGEEWLYFIQLKSDITYLPLKIKNIGGYLEDGLTVLNKNMYATNTRNLWQGKLSFKICLVLFLREVRTLMRFF
jgi:glycosyltransferase involved in cell wall biosynthesis